VDEVTAQQAYRVLLRDHVGPELRSRGFKGPSGRYEKVVGDYRVRIGFQKSKWSDRAHVDYRLNLGVTHPPSQARFNEANQEAKAIGKEWEYAPAGSWYAAFPGPNVAMSGRILDPESFARMESAPPEHHWITLRPTDDIADHAARLMRDIDNCVSPEIERQLLAPLEKPTPPQDRPDRPSRDELGQQILESTLNALRAAGVRNIRVNES
jgi:hypothetical protein